jgi:hypothetical protein
MSSIPTPSNDREITYQDPCQPWCYYWPGPDHEPDGDENYCHRPVGRAVIGVTPDDDRYEITATVVYERLPVGAPIEQHANANRHHRNVIQIVFLLCGEKELPKVTTDVKPGDARSLAAALIHGADLAEGIIR